MCASVCIQVSVSVCVCVFIFGRAHLLCHYFFNVNPPPSPVGGSVGGNGWTPAVAAHADTWVMRVAILLPFPRTACYEKEAHVKSGAAVGIEDKVLLATYLKAQGGRQGAVHAEY